MEKEIKLSVIIPAYNAEKYIRSCLNSVGKYSSSEFEVIVINDGSTDQTAQIIQDASKKDKRIVPVNIQNGGVSRARNIGIKKANGRYLTFIDADDIILEDGMESMLQFIENMENSEDILGIFNYKEIDKRDHVITNVNMTEKLKNEQGILECFISDFQMNMCWAKIYSKSIIEKYKIRFPEDVKIGEDAVFVGSYLNHIHRYYLQNQFVYGYRQLAEGTMNTNRANITNRFLEDLEQTFSAKKDAYMRYMNNKRGRFLFYSKFTEYIVVTVNLVIKTNKTLPQKKAEIKLMMNNSFVDRNLKEAEKNHNIGWKRETIIHIYQNNILCNIYIYLKELLWRMKK